ncbi:lytic polysaccharide monooxygenase auxiliary activity family 9 protein [Streptomyces boncukensis]|uniref:lytic polysaccharide monooxygenase auxiliary activity family 9 protein n=1 Tax=Streptomyces boncukensis TaxID=2711219 RepID=UPI0030BA16E4
MALGGSLVLAPGAAGHGTAVSPPSRNYDCWQRWGDDFQNPEMATEDPMCWQAWQADPNAMWNWNGLYREGDAGDHEGAVPDGQLCSAGHTSAGRYDALDVPGDWHTTEVGTDFTFVNNDQANHGADYYRVYVTKQGFDPAADELGWGDLELVAETGKIAPGEGEPAETGVDVEIDVSAPGRTGHHIVFMIWQASHLDQTFYSCSDVSFSGVL